MRSESRQFLELLLAMTEKELRVRYKNTVFGFVWIVVNPVLQMIVIGFVFRFLINRPIANYYQYLFLGLLTWNFLSLSLTKTTPSIVWERSLVKKAAFPRSVIPISIITSNLIHYLLALSLFLFTLIPLRTVSLVTLPFFLAGISTLLLFTVGLSLLFTALNVRYRDINFFVQAILIIWFYATPIVYSLVHVPAELAWLWLFNPMTTILQFFYHGFLGAPLPRPELVLANILMITGVFFAGIRVFNTTAKYFDDWV